MKELKNIDKRMPYTEREDYVQQLISQTTERTISLSKHRTITLRRYRMTAIAAAVAALLVITGLSVVNSPTEQPVAQNKEVVSPMDEFLSSISDEEAQLLASYTVETVPEYD
jgi:hypothetical protein